MFDSKITTIHPTQGQQQLKSHCGLNKPTADKDIKRRSQNGQGRRKSFHFERHIFKTIILRQHCANADATKPNINTNKPNRQLKKKQLCVTARLNQSSIGQQRPKAQPRHQTARGKSDCSLRFTEFGRSVVARYIPTFANEDAADFISTHKKF